MRKLIIRTLLALIGVGVIAGIGHLVMEQQKKAAIAKGWSDFLSSVRACDVVYPTNEPTFEYDPYRFEKHFRVQRDDRSPAWLERERDGLSAVETTVLGGEEGFNKPHIADGDYFFGERDIGRGIRKQTSQDQVGIYQSCLEKAQKGDAKAVKVVARILLKKGDRAAVQWLEKEGTGEAYLMLGQAYEFGVFDVVDMEAVLAAYQTAADKGHALGEWYLAMAQLQAGQQKPSKRLLESAKKGNIASVDLLSSTAYLFEIPHEDRYFWGLALDYLKKANRDGVSHPAWLEVERYGELATIHSFRLPRRYAQTARIGWLSEPADEGKHSSDVLNLGNFDTMKVQKRAKEWIATLPPVGSPAEAP